MVEKSQEFPDLLDAKFTSLVHMDKELKEYFKKYLVPGVSMSEHMLYKYQVLADGNGAAYPRGLWHMFSNSVTFKVDSDYAQWFYSALKPFEHYIPIKSDLSNLKEMLIWATKSDSKIKKISANAQEFAQNNLRLEDSLYYVYILLNQVSKLQRLVESKTKESLLT